MTYKWIDNDYIHYITNETLRHNRDNITRTKAYQRFYINHPEIRWALLASVVSRNAGWNMTDLHLPSYFNILGKRERSRLFMTYERANWLIFSDAYPQLLAYMLSKQFNKPQFKLLSYFHVSQYMINEWEIFWHSQNKQRLVNALIINEQNVIQKPIIEKAYFKKNVFLSLPYFIQDYLMMNAVLLPTKSETIYGKFIFGFTNLSNRIELGQFAVEALFGEAKRHQRIYDFLLSVEHTGSRRDYEKFLGFQSSKSPDLRSCYSKVQHQNIVQRDWYERVNIKKRWIHPYVNYKIKDISSTFYRKRLLLTKYAQMKIRVGNMLKM